MTDGEFWGLIAASRDGWNAEQVDGNMHRQAERLAMVLDALPTSAVLEYERCFREKHFRAYRWDLWAAAHIIGSGCSDDGFTDFRYWLISIGETTFSNALVDPDSLDDVLKVGGVEDTFFEELGAIPYSVLERRGEEDELAAIRPEHPKKPLGSRWTEETLPTLCPRLWATFGEA